MVEIHGGKKNHLDYDRRDAGVEKVLLAPRVARDLEDGGRAGAGGRGLLGRMRAFLSLVGAGTVVTAERS